MNYLGPEWQEEVFAQRHDVRNWLANMWNIRGRGPLWFKEARALSQSIPDGLPIGYTCNGWERNGAPYNPNILFVPGSSPPVLIIERGVPTAHTLLQTALAIGAPHHWDVHMLTQYPERWPPEYNEFSRPQLLRMYDGHHAEHKVVELNGRAHYGHKRERSFVIIDDLLKFLRHGMDNQRHRDNYIDLLNNAGNPRYGGGHVLVMAIMQEKDDKEVKRLLYGTYMGRFPNVIYGPAPQDPFDQFQVVQPGSEMFYIPIVPPT